jgi:hypothetical protein
LVDRNIVASTHRCNTKVCVPQDSVDTIDGGLPSRALDKSTKPTHGERVLARERANGPWPPPDWAVRYAMANAGWLDSIYRQWWDDGIDEMPEGPGA